MQNHIKLAGLQKEKMMKLSVIYDTKTENTKQCALWVAEGMMQNPGIEARCFSIEDIDEAFIRDSHGVVIGSPTYAAHITPALWTWMLQEGGKLGLAGKLGGAFATQQYTHGGANMAIQSILTWEMAIGMLCYSGGGSFGKPVIHLGPVAVNHNIENTDLENYREYFVIYGRRFAAKCNELWGAAKE